MFDELKQILLELLQSEDATGCSPDLTVVCSSSMVRLREWHRENVRDRNDVRYELTSELDGNDTDELQSTNYLDAVEEAFSMMQRRVTEWDKETAEEIQEGEE